MENRNHSSHLGFAAVKLVLELVEHDAKAKGDAVGNHVDKLKGNPVVTLFEESLILGNLVVQTNHMC